jgi:hypothetical protein
MIDKFFKWANWHAVSGEWVPWAIFLQEFHRFLITRKLDPTDWPQSRIEWALGPSMPVGRGPRNIKIVANVSREFLQPRRWVKDDCGNVRLEAPYIKIAG